MIINNTLQRTLGVAALLLGLTTAPTFAQTAGTASMNIELSDVLELTVNNNSSTVRFATAEAYRRTQGALSINQLTVTSNRPFDVSVQADGDLMNGSESIPISNVRLKNDQFPNEVTLSTTPQIFVKGAPAAIAQNLDNVYVVSGGDDLLKGAGRYTTTLTFTASYN